MPSRKLSLAVLFGGRSSEHSVSCVSAGSLLAAIDRDRYDVVAVGIARDGSWVLASDDPASLEVRDKELPSVDGSGAAVALPGDPTVGGLVVLEPGTLPSALAGVDVVFPLLHGPYGEDGTIQGLLEMAGIPYVGSGVLSSAVCMDKEFMKAMLAARGLRVGPHVVVTDDDWRANQDSVLQRIEALGWPVFVKPARGGSSIGISKVSDLTALRDAVETARVHDPKVIVEASFDGREIECGVLDGLRGERARASVPSEIHVAAGYDFYDFEAKYLSDATAFDIPADLDEATTAAVQRDAVAAFAALGCSGLARVDFFLTGPVEDGGLVINEVNTMPGFTPSSMYPRMWEASGVPYAELVDHLVEVARDRGTGLR